MSAIGRGVKNAARNPARSGAVILLLGVSVAFALSLLLANQAVKNKTNDLKKSGATTLTIRPAGSQGFEGGGEPLTVAQLAKVKALANVSDTAAILSVNTFRGGFARPGESAAIATDSTTTEPEANISLESSIVPGTLGRRNFGSSSTISGAPTATFKLPVRISGIAGDLDSNGTNYTMKAGGYFSTEDGYEAMVGTALATKNNLSISSTFTAYSQTFKVVGIFDAGNAFANDAVLIPLKTAQTLSTHTDEISQIIVKSDSLDHVATVKAAVTSSLGSDKVDVTSSAQNVQDALDSLATIQKISVAGVFIAFAAAIVIVLMVMIMIVRERRKEIAVLKAIGASNFKISLQFVAEAVTITLASVVIGGALAVVSGNKLTSILVTTNTKSSTTSTTTTGRVLRFGPGQEQNTSASLLKDVKTSAGASLIIESLAAVVLIGALGSALPAYAIAKVRPAEVMRGE